MGRRFCPENWFAPARFARPFIRLELAPAVDVTKVFAGQFVDDVREQWSSAVQLPRGMKAPPKGDRRNEPVIPKIVAKLRHIVESQLQAPGTALPIVERIEFPLAPTIRSA